MRERRVAFKVKLGGRVLSRECTWSEVERLKERVKRFARWQPEGRLWEARIEDVLRHFEEAADLLAEAFGEQGEGAIRELRSLDAEARGREAERGELVVLPSGDDELGWQLLRRCAKRHPITIGGERVTYYRLDPRAAIEAVIEWGAEPEAAGEALLDLLSSLDPLLSEGQRKVVRGFSELLRAPPGCALIREWGIRGALVVMPEPLDEGSISRIEEALSVDYYRQRMGEGGVELVPTRLKLVRILSSRVFRIPYALVDPLERVMGELGYRVIERIDWPLAELPEVRRNFTLYAFQEEALEAWRASRFRGSIVMPTGAGKTYVALAAIASLRVPTLVCVTTVELAKQWVRRIRECLGLRAGLLAAGEKKIEAVTVATYHSAVRALPEIYDRFGLVIYDEGHHLPARTFKRIALALKARYSMVLSATPERADRNEALIYRVAGEPVYTTSYFELVTRGLLAPLKVEVVPVELSSEELEEYMRAESELQGPRRTSELIKIASRARAKIEALKQILAREGGKVIVFCQFLDQALEAYRAAKSVEARVALITGSTPKGERLRALESFKAGSVRVVVASTVLDEGVDVPDADVAVILSGTGQVRQMVQRVGRVLRWMPGKVAKVYEVVAAGTIEEALSRSRSIFKLISPREVNAALEVALAAYRRMSDVIERLSKARPEERAALVEEARACYVRIVAELLSKGGLHN